MIGQNKISSILSVPLFISFIFFPRNLHPISFPLHSYFNLGQLIPRWAVSCLDASLLYLPVFNFLSRPCCGQLHLPVPSGKSAWEVNF